MPYRLEFTSSLGAFAAMLMFACTASPAAEGTLDSGFGDNGRVLFGWSVDSGVTKNDAAVAVLASADGGAILVGNATDAGFAYSGRNAIGIAKLTSAGQFDSAFGDVATPGQTKIHGGGSNVFAYQIRANGAALQADGKIVIVGNAYSAALARQYVVVWRLNADGSPDLNFNGTGEVDLDRGLGNEFDSGLSVTVIDGPGLGNSGYVVDQGRIVVAGSIDFSPQIVIASAWLKAINPDGSLVAGATGDFQFEPTMCADGYHDSVLQAIHSQYDAASDTVSIYAAGNCIPRPFTGRILYPFMAKLDGSLTLANTWGNSEAGISQLYNPGGASTSYPNSAVTSLDADLAGNVVFAGYFNQADGTPAAMYGALNPAGGFNFGWTNDGVTIAAYNNGLPAYAIKIDPFSTALFPEDNVIIAGHHSVGTCPPPPTVCGGLGYPFWTAQVYFGTISSAFCSPNTSLVVCNYTPNTTYNDGGFYAMSYTRGRRILLAGFVTFTDGTTDFQVMRLLGDEIFTGGMEYPVINFQ